MVDWYTKSYVASKDALKNIQIGWGTSLEAKSPAIVEFLILGSGLTTTGILFGVDRIGTTFTGGGGGEGNTPMPHTHQV